MKSIIIVGASGFGREIVQYVEDINLIEPIWEIQGFLDDNLNALDSVKSDFKIIGTIKDYEPKEDDYFVCALAFPEVKKKIVEQLKGRGAKFVSIIHPTVRINKYATIGEGVVITPNSNVNCGATVGDFVSVLNSGIGHDAHVGDYTTLSGRCSINGHVNVGNCVYMGCNVCIAPSKKIGDNAVLGMGSVVVANVKPNTTVFGNPAKRINF